MKILISYALFAVLFLQNSFAKPTANSKIINSASLATSTTLVISDIVNLGNIQKFSLFSFMGSGSSATGTVSILLSNDVTDDPSLVSNWVVYSTDKTFTTPTTKLLSSIVDVATKWVKVEYTKADQTTGTLTTIFNAP